ncbi:MAG: hypothetical protein D6701_14350, partial [Gemmatimonadetes bacterium]
MRLGLPRWLRGRRGAGRERTGRARREPSRLLLSLFFIIHFGAIAAYTFPVAEGAFQFFPERVREPVRQAALAAHGRVIYPSLVYLSMFSLHQHWSLFGPEPLNWGATLE